MPSRNRFRGPLILLLIFIGFFWKLTLTRQFTWLDSPDFANQVMPWFEVQSRAMRHGIFPLWDPFEFAGQSNLGPMQTGGAYPFNWLLFLWPVTHGFIRITTLHWYFVLIHFTAGLFCYWLCRDLGRSRLAAICAGAAFGLGGFMGNTDWPQMLNGGVWAPLVFLFFLRSFEPGSAVRFAGLSGACLGVAFLSGHHQVPVFTSLAVGGCWIWLIYRHWQAHQLRSAAEKLGLFGLFAALVGAFQIIPGIEYGKLAIRWVGAAEPVGWSTPVPYTVHSGFGLQPLSLLGITIPYIYVHASAYIGWTVIVLAFFAVAHYWTDLRVRLFAAVALGGLLFSLAGNTIYHGLIYSLIPLVEKARNASMAVFLFHFGLAVLVSFGIDALAESSLRDSPWPSRMLRLLLAASGAIALIALLWTVRKDNLLTHPGVVASAFAALLVASVLYAWKHGNLKPSSAGVLLFLLMLLEFGNETGFAYQQRDKPDSLVSKLGAHGDIADFLRRQHQPVRAEKDSDVIPYNFGDWHAIDSFDGYGASLTSDFSRIQGDYWGRMLFGVNYFLGNKPRRDGQQEVFVGRSGVKVYSNPEAFPRAWSVHQTFSIPNANSFPEQIASNGPALRNKAFFVGAAPQVVKCPGLDDIKLVSRSFNNLAIDAELACPGVVIAGEAYFPGWKARVDGQPAQLWAADYILRGVVVPAGSHRVEMYYSPSSVWIGASLSILGLLGAGMLAFHPRFRRGSTMLY